ncbi:MAG: Isoniazid-induced protein IniC [Acidimicrobiales bacterium]|nr:MAG: hypothetical protein EDR02_14085 [Actinomycetota bacterium]MBV6509290.1 Isoniazid-induced protein IniC [Acidimicrobiales bacterium]RIK03985.1 MAG: hypothetical protein DCC48_14865 [Acidobacteriota bacterium]
MTLTNRVLEVCDDALAQLQPGEGRDLALSVREKLLVPLRVTVAGSVSAGKSTLVNALLGQRIAPVDAGECTRVVTSFEYGHPERAEVVSEDGSRSPIPLTERGLPSELGVPLDQVRLVEVYLSNANLRTITIIDTPGLNTVTGAGEQSAAFLGVGTSREAVDSSKAIGQADALVFLMPHLRQADAEVLTAFRSLYDGTGLSAVNSIGVLSKVDQLTREARPLDVAQPIAARVAQDLRSVVADVMPVVGLLAETANAAQFTEDDARGVVAVAAVEDELDREDMLLSPEEFLRFDQLDLGDRPRQRLLRLLGLYGLQVAMEAVDAGARGAAPLIRALDEQSGFAPLRDQIIGRFAQQADLLKAHVAVCDLQRLSYLRSDPANSRVLRSLRSPLEHLELDPEMHALRVTEVMHAAGRGELVLPADLMADLERLTSRSDPLGRLGATNRADAGQAATTGAARWSSWGQDPRRSPHEARWARDVKTAFELLWAEVDRESGAS